MKKFKAERKYETRNTREFSRITGIYVIKRTESGNLVYNYEGKKRWSKIFIDKERETEYIKPDSPAQSPIFYADCEKVERNSIIDLLPEIDIGYLVFDKNGILCGTIVGMATIGFSKCFVVRWTTEKRFKLETLTPELLIERELNIKKA